MARLLAGFIRLYQKLISPLLPPTCRFTPSCSQYAIEALEAHGVFKGLTLAAWRIARCQPFCEGGHDPVPPSGQWPACSCRAGKDSVTR